MKLRILLTIAALFVNGALFAESAKNVPMLFNYQSVLTDEGGNPLADGISNLKFRILNDAGTVLYEETQGVEIVAGAVSVIVGNGLSASGAPTGGVPFEALDPSEAKYLQVTVDGQMPYDKLEMVSSPYAVFSGTALGLAEGTLTSEMIGEKAVKVEHVSDELMKKFEELVANSAVSQTGFAEFKNNVQGSAGAGTVGVTNDFVYSGANTVQGVLADLDIAVKKRQEEVEWAKKDYDAKIGSEAKARSDQDTVLQNNLVDHLNTKSVHGSDGEVVGMNTLNNAISAVQLSLDTSVPPASAVAKAWIRFSTDDGGNATILDSYNIVSVVRDPNVDDFIITFGQPMSSSNYVVVGSTGKNNINPNNLDYDAAVFTLGYQYPTYFRATGRKGGNDGGFTDNCWFNMVVYGN